MSVLARIGRALQRPRRIELDGATRYGMRGEELAQRYLNKEDYQVVHNPIVPHPREARQYLETDAIVYAEGSVFCVEIKRYRGRLQWSRSANGKHQLIQYKPGNYGEAVFERTHPDPLAKTKFYINNLKRFLSRVDGRFGTLYFTPVVAFITEDCEIDEVHDFEGVKSGVPCKRCGPSLTLPGSSHRLSPLPFLRRKGADLYPTPA